MAGTTTVVLNPGVGGASIGVDSDGTSSYEVIKIGVGAYAVFHLEYKHAFE